MTPYSSPAIFFVAVLILTSSFTLRSVDFYHRLASRAPDIERLEAIVAQEESKSFMNSYDQGWYSASFIAKIFNPVADFLKQWPAIEKKKEMVTRLYLIHFIEEYAEVFTYISDENLGKICALIAASSLPDNCKNNLIYRIQINSYIWSHQVDNHFEIDQRLLEAKLLKIIKQALDRWEKLHAYWHIRKIAENQLEDLVNVPLQLFNHLLKIINNSSIGYSEKYLLKELLNDFRYFHNSKRDKYYLKHNNLIYKRHLLYDPSSPMQ
jgi:hypothetical protein